jgi:hypothetical protein
MSIAPISRFTAAFEIAGFSVTRVNHVFGGQYLWLEAGLDGAGGWSIPDAGRLPAHAAWFGGRETATLARLKARLGELSGGRRTAIWGAGGKGVTLANLLDPRSERFACVIDINPNKHGCFVAGSGHEIVGLDEALHRRVEIAVLTNPNYRPEIEAMIGKAGAALALVGLA